MARPFCYGLLVLALWLPAWARAADAQAAGTTPAAAATAAAPVAMLWSDPGLTSAAGVPAAGLEGLLTAAGFRVRQVGTADLAQPGALDGTAPAALVLPYGADYPAALASTLPAYLAKGGLLVTLGTGALSRPLYPAAQGWFAADAAAPGRTPVALGFGNGWTLAEIAPGAEVGLQAAKDGRAGTFRVDPPGAFAYRGCLLPAVDADDVVLAFAARGDAHTPRLCLELRERDGSRWKAVVPLCREWTDYRLHAGQFVPYASEKLGRMEGTVRARDLDRLLLGVTAAMAGPGAHRFEVRALRLEPAAVATAALTATPAFAGPEQEVGRWFGDRARPPTRRPALTGAAVAVRPWEARRLVVPEGVPLPARAALHGRFGGVAVGTTVTDRDTASAPTPRPDLATRLRTPRAVVWLPVLRTDHILSTTSEDAAGLAWLRTGPGAGGRWLCVGLEAAAAVTDAGVTGVLTDALRLAQTAVVSDGVWPRFRVVDGAVVLDAVLRARSPSGQPTDLVLDLRMGLGGRALPERRSEVRLEAKPGVAVEYAMAEGIPLRDSDWLDLEIEAAPAADGPPVLGPLRFRLQAREALRQVADHLVAAAADDGRLHGYSFIDNRGMRTLLGAAEILGRKAYRDPAFRWGERMVREQRTDGGYRMGYGITAKGEECYVADGGEIAVAIARLVSYTEGRGRLDLERSLDAYMAYRESFRVGTGGIGVGWCLQDYGRRPVVPFDAPTLVYAPELNTYTIGCTLAAAYAHAALLQSVPLERRAAADADWLMHRAPALHGAFIESFMYAHALTPDAAHRALFAEYIGQAFSARARESGAAGRSWWLAGGGRSALDLDGLAYVLARVGDDPALRAEMMRATCCMFSPDSPESVLTVIGLPDPGHDGWIYTCYGTLGLVDVIRPVVSLDGLVPAP